jgi:glycerophosphoryl diester phosphodiesterase
MKIIAHRGASQYAPENSLAAFQLALTHPIAGIEFDVHYINGRALVIHDQTLTRTHQLNIPISALTAEQLMTYEIPNLEQVLTVVSSHHLSINIEVKSVDDNTLFIRHLLDLQQRRLIHSDTVLSSFNHCLLDTYQKAGINTQYGGLIAHLPKDLAQYAVLGRFDIVATAQDMVSPELIADAHRLGKQVWVYTVNDFATAQRLAQWQVDAIFSNDTLMMQPS